MREGFCWLRNFFRASFCQLVRVWRDRRRLHPSTSRTALPLLYRRERDSGRWDADSRRQARRKRRNEKQWEAGKFSKTIKDQTKKLRVVRKWRCRYIHRLQKTTLTTEFYNRFHTHVQRGTWSKQSTSWTRTAGISAAKNMPEVSKSWIPVHLDWSTKIGARSKAWNCFGDTATDGQPTETREQIESSKQIKCHHTVDMNGDYWMLWACPMVVTHMRSFWPLLYHVPTLSPLSSTSQQGIDAFVSPSDIIGISSLFLERRTRRTGGRKAVLDFNKAFVSKRDFD